MRILFNGFQQAHLLPVMERIIDAHGVKFCATIDTERKFFRDEVECWHHDFWQVIYGNYPVDVSTIRPLDESDLLHLAPCENVVLRMMDRLDPLKAFSYADRKEMYLKHVQYWLDFLRKGKFTHFIFHNIPHEIYDYVLWYLAKDQGIPCLFFIETPIPEAVLLLDDWRAEPRGLQEHYHKLMARLSSGEDLELAANFQHHWESFQDRGKDPVPFYMAGNISALAKIRSKSYLLRRSFHYLNKIKSSYQLKDCFNPAIRQKILADTLGRYRARKSLLKHDGELNTAYNARVSPLTTDSAYIYVPLHFQPECTTSPLGGAYVDQILMVKLLHSCLGKDLLLYVKEHPVQRSWGRSIEFYRELAALPQVRLVDKASSSFDLIKNATAIATITGTAGWEALFYEKPVLMFGDFFYKYSPGVLAVKTLSDCQNALQKIAAGFKPKKEEQKVFLRALQEVAVRGYCDLNYGATTGISAAENTKNLAVALMQRL